MLQIPIFSLCHTQILRTYLFRKISYFIGFFGLSNPSRKKTAFDDMAFLQITITELRGLFLASVYNFYAETKKVSNSRSGPLLLFGSNFLTHVWKISKTFIKKILLQGKYQRYSDPKLNSTFPNNKFNIYFECPSYNFHQN